MFMILSKYQLYILFRCLNGSIRSLQMVQRELVEKDVHYNDLELVKEKIIDYLCWGKIL